MLWVLKQVEDEEDKRGEKEEEGELQRKIEGDIQWTFRRDSCVVLVCCAKPLCEIVLCVIYHLKKFQISLEDRSCTYHQ